MRNCRRCRAAPKEGVQSKRRDRSFRTVPSPLHGTSTTTASNVPARLLLLLLLLLLLRLLRLLQLLLSFPPPRSLRSVLRWSWRWWSWAWPPTGSLVASWFVTSRSDDAAAATSDEDDK